MTNYCNVHHYLFPLNLGKGRYVEYSLKIIVYPNSGEAYNADTKTWMGLSDPELFVNMAKEWRELGADIIGGCCRIGPDHIKSMSNLLN